MAEPFSSTVGHQGHQGASYLASLPPGSHVHWPTANPLSTLEFGAGSMTIGPVVADREKARVVHPQWLLPSASHGTLTLEWQRRARAMHSSCLSPTEKFSPFSTTRACSLSGNLEICNAGEDTDYTGLSYHTVTLTALITSGLLVPNQA